MKIYTKTGDDGTTSLFGGKRLFKNNNRVDAYGNVDELNSCIGFTADHLEDSSTIEFLRSIQHILFIVGSHLATVDEKYIKTLPSISEAEILLLENKIDEYHETLPKMTHFILPGGHIKFRCK